MLDSIWRTFELGPREPDNSPLEMRRFDVHNSVRLSVGVIEKAYPGIDDLPTRSEPVQPEASRPEPVKSPQDGMSVDAMRQMVQESFVDKPANPLFDQ